MNDTQNLIINLFNDLDDSHKLECLKTLQFSADPSQVIKRFSERHQAVHKVNISFNCNATVTEGVILTEAILNTEFGKFKGVGKTSLEAKFLAVMKAQQAEYQSIKTRFVPERDTYDPFGVLKTLEANYDGTFSEELIS